MDGDTLIKMQFVLGWVIPGITVKPATNVRLMYLPWGNNSLLSVFLIKMALRNTATMLTSGGIEGNHLNLPG